MTTRKTTTSARINTLTLGFGFMLVVAGMTASHESAASSLSPEMSREAEQPRVQVVQGTGSGNITYTTAGGESIALHQTSGVVTQARALGVSGSPAAVALWNETDHAGVVRSMYAYSIDGANFSRALESTGMVRLRYANFDPLVQVPEVPAHLSADAQPEHIPAGAAQPYIVQFAVPPLEAMLDEVRAPGATPLRYLPDEAQIVSLTAVQRDQVAALPYVRWVGPFHPAYRLDEALLPQAQDNPAELPQQIYCIAVFERGLAQQQVVADRITALGGQILALSAEGFRIQAMLGGEGLLEIAHMNEVHFIDPRGEPGTDMNIARQIGGADPLLIGLGFTGQGVRGEVMDAGCLTTHQAFQGPAPLVHGGSLDVQSHGTSTYGCVFGNGAANAAGTGMLPAREQGIFADYNQLAGLGGAVSRYTHTSELVNPGGAFRAVFQSNSWGGGLTTAYTSVSTEMDDIIIDFDIVIVQSQSNAGSQSSRPEAWAKNAVSIGGIQHLNSLSRTDDSWTSASVGPAADGRIKPDLAHFYDNVLCPTSASTTAYDAGFNGTSSATPIVAGHFGLLFQMWHQGVFPGHGAMGTVFNSRPHAATAKALMINSAFRYNWLAGGANGTLTRVRQGWGMPDLAQLYNNRLKTVIINETDLLTPGGSKTYSMIVAAGEPEFRATLVYTDLPGTTSATTHRINDLSLKVTSPSSVVYWGNNGLSAGNFSTSGGVSNTKDTVENVFVQSPQAGTWTVQVFGDVIVQDSHVETPALDADYALVVAGVPVVPVNDACAASIVVPAGPTAFTTVGATTDGPDECNVGGFTQISNDIWYRYLANCAGTVTVSLCGSSYNAKLAVYQGACPTLPSTAIACSDNVCGTSPEVTFNTPGSVLYRIRVGGFNGAAGTGTMVITCTPLPQCPPDINNSGTVDIDDLLAVINAWGPCAGCPEDVNNSGTVDIDDLLAVINGWGPCP